MYISVETHPREARCVRVRVDGVDITRRCYEADDERGFATCFRWNAEGKPYLDPTTGEVARERLTGHVEIDFPNGLD
jgi:hypothetical protein